MAAPCHLWCQAGTQQRVIYDHIRSGETAGIYMGAANFGWFLYTNYFYELQVHLTVLVWMALHPYGNNCGLFVSTDLLVTDNEAGGNGGYLLNDRVQSLVVFIDTFPAVRSNTAENGGVVYAPARCLCGMR